MGEQVQSGTHKDRDKLEPISVIAVSNLDDVSILPWRNQDPLSWN